MMIAIDFVSPTIASIVLVRNRFHREDRPDRHKFQRLLPLVILSVARVGQDNCKLCRMGRQQHDLGTTILPCIRNLAMRHRFVLMGNLKVLIESIREWKHEPSAKDVSLGEQLLPCRNPVHRSGTSIRVLPPDSTQAAAYAPAWSSRIHLPGPRGGHYFDILPRVRGDGAETETRLHSPRRLLVPSAASFPILMVNLRHTNASRRR